MSVTRLAIYALLLLAACSTPVWAQPIAQYTFNDGTARDISGNGHDGVLLDAATIVDDPERGRVLQINQSGMQADGPFDITTSFTLSAWIKLDVPRTGRYYFGGPWWFRTDNQGSPEHYWIEIRYPGGNFLNKIDTRVEGNAQGQLDGQWHHLVVILPEDGAFRVYFDGVEAPFRDADPTRTHDFGGTVGPLFFGTENAAGSNAIEGYMDDIRVYNYAVGPEEISELQTESEPALARAPIPADEATHVSPDVVLSWTAGQFAAAHDVYLGTTLDDVNRASRTNPMGTLLSQDQMDNTCDPESLELGQTYYWRVDEVNAPPSSTVFKGEVWSFTIEPVAYPIGNVMATASGSDAGTGPENTVNGSGLNDQDQHSVNAADMWLVTSGGEPAWIQYEFDRMYKLHELWVWNYNVQFEPVLGFGAKDVTVEYSVDGVEWIVLDEVEFAQATATADYERNTTVDLQGVAATFVRLTIHSGFGVLGQYGLSEVRFFHIPVQARKPQPADGATEVGADSVLSWNAGREAASHEIYLSNAEADVIDGTALIDTVEQSRYDLSSLDLMLGTTYYWKVNEVNEAEAVSTWEGDIWNFTTPAFIVVEDFEIYTDDVEGEETIWQTWIDGYEDASNGSQVGYLDAPFAERALVNSGRQSMPLFYDNTGGIAYSEAEITFDTPQDWIRAGIGILTVYFQGSEDNTGGQVYVKINGVEVVYDGSADAITSASWTQWNIDLDTVNTNLNRVDTLAIGVEGSGSGILYVDDFRLLPAAAP